MSSILEVLSYGREHLQLDETFRSEKANIPGFHGSLFKYQQLEVAALIDLENAQQVKINNITYHFSAGIFSNPTGSGKTISMLAKILLNPIPKQKFDIINVGKGLTICRQYKKNLRCTIIFAGVSVINQWIEAIQQFTDLKHLRITDMRNLTQMVELINNGRINEYDIVLVKNGTIARAISIAPFVHEQRNLIGKPSIYNIIANIKVTWACVIIDDFDYIKLPRNAGRIQTLFTWYVSATNTPLAGKIYTNNQFLFNQHIAIYRGLNGEEISGNEILFDKINVRSHGQIIMRYNRLTNPIFYEVLVNNNNVAMINAAREMIPEDMREVIYMMNGDAINEAAARLGIVANSHSDILRHLMRERFEEYKLVMRILKFIEDHHRDQRQSFIDAGLNLEEYQAHPTYTEQDIIACRIPQIEYPGLTEMFARMLTVYQQRRQVLERSLDKVKSDLKHGDCPICLGDLKTKPACVILTCCNCIGCPQCMITSCNFQIIENDSRGRCPMCRQPILLSCIIFINEHLRQGIEQQDQQNEDEKKENDQDDQEKKKENDKKEKRKEKLDAPLNPNQQRDKISILVEIISGHLPFEAQETKVNLPSLQRGTTERIDHDGFTKVLCFTDHDSSINTVKIRLTEEKIPWLSLSGSVDQISKTVRQFAAYHGNIILLVNAASYCAGLNLQFVTHIVYFHKMNNIQIEEQIAGRGQRIGRTSTLKIIYLKYLSEDQPPEEEQPPEEAEQANAEDEDAEGDEGDDVEGEDI